MTTDAKAERTNRLAHETSPYLLSHATNPVDWYPWGEEALRRAERESKPIFLSIGYAACHWCHVMERESFEDPDTASLMNEHYICIKVDREERPDLDEIYMAATMAMTGGGGWPMSVFLTPDRRPFFAGTYFPPTSRHGSPAFRQVLARIAEAWSTERADVLAQAEELTRVVVVQASHAAPGAIGEAQHEAFVASMRRAFDPEWGGFGGAPKFPPSASLSLLLALGREGDAPSMVQRTLDAMKDGGMYDHVGGGFARYSTDREWLVPHFEKMLYDNAQLARVYLESFQITLDPEHRRVAIETLDYALREMQGEHGGFFSATDADSEGEEGKFFVWTLAEIEEALGEVAAARFAAFYDVTEGGNWEGRTILRTPRPLAEVARELETSPDLLRAELDAGKRTLYERRRRRVPPLLDDKVLVSWNALLIGALSFAHRVLGDARYLEGARRAAAMIDRHLVREDGGLFGTYRAGKAHLAAYLEDYAYLADALVDLYEASGDRAHLDRALALAERMLADFSSDEGAALCQTARDHERLLVRARDGADGAIPNANAKAAQALARLGAHLGRPELVERARAALEAHGELVAKHPRAFASTLAAWLRVAEPPVEVAIVGDPSTAGFDALVRALGRTYLPNAIVALHDVRRGPAPTDLPLLAGKAAGTDGALAYVCRDFACAAPVSNVEAFASMLAAAGPRAALSARG